jgi:peptide/nickel transport system permease protein
VLGIVSVLFTSVPIYVLGLLALYVFSSDVGALHVFDGAGTYVPVSHDAARWFKSLLLPWLTLSVALSGIYSRVLRTGLVEAMAQPHIQAARAKGLSERRILTLHAGRLAIVPYLTLLGLDIGSLLGGAVLTEVVFGIPGLGHLALESVETSDLPTTQGVVLLSGVFIIVANLVVDLAYTALDPRVRTG